MSDATTYGEERHIGRYTVCGGARAEQGTWVPSFRIRNFETGQFQESELKSLASENAAVATEIGLRRAIALVHGRLPGLDV